MRILSFDPGYERLGVAVVEKTNGQETLLYSDCMRTKATLSFAERLAELGAAAVALIEQWQPEGVALEEVFFEKNQKTGMQIAEVRGMLTYIAAARGLPIHQYTPAEVKIAVTGYGKSDKKAVAAMVPRLVAMSTAKRLDDELDAIAVGLTCLASLRMTPKGLA
jgi:crossover junction endodeoxyribonuclease RuvC